MNAGRSGSPSLIRRHSGVALDIFDFVDTYTEFLGRDLRNGDAQPLPEIHLAAEYGHRAVAVHGQKGIDLLRIEYAPCACRALCEGSGRQTGECKADSEGAALEDCAAREAGCFHDAFMSASLSRCRHDGAHDTHMRSAAAEVAIQGQANIVLAGFLFFGQQCSCAHDHAAGAVATLRHLLRDESGLDRVRIDAVPGPRAW